jgi:dihydroorotase
MDEIINKITFSPASILGIDGGTLSVGATADICLFDNNNDWQLTTDAINSNGKNTPFLGWNFQGKVKHTIVNGDLLFSDAAV